MIWALVAVILGLLATLAYVIHESRTERSELEDRLMSTFTPVAVTTYKAHQEEAGGDVSYVDEAREAELSPSWNT